MKITRRHIIFAAITFMMCVVIHVLRLHTDQDGRKIIGDSSSLVFLRKNSVFNDETQVDIDALSDQQVRMTLHTVLDNTEILCRRKLRMGNLGDGGWEVCDDANVRPRGNCIVYSFGINNDFSFDDQVAKVYGCHVYSFDPSMKADTHNRSSHVHFYKIGISDHDHVNKDGWQMKTLGEIRAMLGHQHAIIDVLKMDVEEAEWVSVPQMVGSGDMKNVRQFLAEFHLGLVVEWHISDMAMNRKRIRVVRELHDAGFFLFYSHKNVHNKGEMQGFPSVRTSCYEVHYIQPDV